jgi:hypothetical protein
MRWVVPLCAVAGVAAADPLPAAYAPLFDPSHVWTYDVATTTYDITDYRHARAPKRTAHSTVTCKVAAVQAFAHGSASRIECDGDLEPGIAGTYVATADGLFRLASFPRTEAELVGGTAILAARPHAWKKVDAGAIHGLKVSGKSWCEFGDTSNDSDGATWSQCFEAGIASGDFEGGEAWRRVSYHLKRR